MKSFYPLDLDSRMIMSDENIFQNSSSPLQSENSSVFDLEVIRARNWTSLNVNYAIFSEERMAASKTRSFSF
jgi:hypothetical protein